jgi:hypothetical protein
VHDASEAGSETVNNDDNRGQERHDASFPARRPYSAPRLTFVGTVASLTLSGSTTPSGDPGTSKKPST